MTSVNAELFHREYDPPTMTCPKCGKESEDLDGFGVLHCEACGYCTHDAIDGDRCSLCGLDFNTVAGFDPPSR
jgi:Zn finger protein HypA/HybF involved in hydrogenase expression